MRYKLDKFKTEIKPINFVGHYRDYYGIDVNKLDGDAQEILAYYKEYGHVGIMMYLQKLQNEQSNQIEPVQTEG